MVGVGKAGHPKLATMRRFKQPSEWRPDTARGRPSRAVPPRTYRIDNTAAGCALKQWLGCSPLYLRSFTTLRGVRSRAASICWGMMFASKWRSAAISTGAIEFSLNCSELGRHCSPAPGVQNHDFPGRMVVRGRLSTNPRSDGVLGDNVVMSKAPGPGKSRPNRSYRADPDSIPCSDCWHRHFHVKSQD